MRLKPAVFVQRQFRPAEDVFGSRVGGCMFASKITHMSPRAMMCVPLFVVAASAACHRNAPKATEEELPIPVIAEPAQMGDIHGFVSATGIVVTLPGADFIAASPETARIVEISKKAGDVVKSGEVLVRFEFPALRAETAARATAVKAAELRLQSARLTQTRVHNLIDRGAVSQKEVDDADHEVADTEAELAQAHAEQITTESLGQRSTIRAPFDGIVAERLHNPGDMVGINPNDAILRVIDPRQVEVNASVALADLTRFADGASARAVAEGKPQPELLRVAARPQPDPGATTVPIRLAFEQSTSLAAGTQVALEIDAEQHSNVVLLPATALIRESNNSTTVFIASGGEAHKRTVVSGLVDAVHVEIDSGVKVGEMVIVQGQSDLRDGSAITISQPDTYAPGNR